MLDGLISGFVAAVQQVFPKPAVQNCQNGRNLNQTFAAPISDVFQSLLRHGVFCTGAPQGVGFVE
jgi:hypothetical protein